MRKPFAKYISAGRKITISADTTLTQLIKLALPVIAGSFLSMAYNFINIIFVGKLGSDAVAAVGSASFYMNLSWGLASLVSVGAGIKVSHAIGKQNIRLAKSYVRSGIIAIIIIAVAYYIIVAFLGQYLIGFVRLNNVTLELAATRYLQMIGISLLFSFQNIFLSGIFVGYGDSRSPFRINSIIFCLNIILDPLFIFVLGMGINGAALATIISQAVATLLFYRKLNLTEAIRPFGVSYRKVLLKNMIVLGISPSIQRVSFTFVAIMMARIISNWGPTAIAVQKVGIQIEAISYMTAGGFMTSLASISGKAFGAKDYSQQWNTFRKGILLAIVIGLFTSSLFVLFPELLFSIFLKEPDSIVMGAEYLTILGFSQLFMCIELMSMGAFFGWGKTNIPAITGITLTILRIPMALAFIHFWSNSLSSVWWSISISSIAKGTLLTILYIILFKAFIRKGT